MMSEVGSKECKLFVDNMHFTLDGSRLSFVDKPLHLGHVLCSNLTDKCDILSKRNSVCGEVNNMLWYFI